MAEAVFNDALTHKIIGCAMKVHSALGSGFQEVIYQNALKIEMSDQNISFVREKEMPIHYKCIPIGNRRVDFFVEAQLWLKLKLLLILRMYTLHK